MGPSLVLTRIRYAKMAAIVVRLFSPPAGLEEVKDWLASVVSLLGKKSTRMDSSSLNYFITLHSRFKVLTETNEMGDLEVLPEKDGNGDGKEPIRIFTNMWKENYQQYLDESLLNSIPEIIITRLYVSGGSGGGGSTGPGIGSTESGGSK